ncbi:MAG: hypothetical protein FJ265_00255 [Planctomycetes bacterium]|nr:hypothetical protein [Planctomycetota bacterium]
MRPFAVLAVSCLLVAFAPAQFAGPGLSWSGSSGGNARSFVPSCTNLPVAAVPGETVTVTVWGDVLSPFVLLAAWSGTQCVQFPGVGNGLILDPPVLTVTCGVLTQTTPCLSCPPGLEPLPFVLPAWLPAGTALALQGGAFGSGQPSFTIAITGRV